MNRQIKKELPPGTTHVYCIHFDNETGDITENMLFLNEIPSEVGYHATCTCGMHYFSQAE
jgi:hypothetical protein